MYQKISLAHYCAKNKQCIEETKKYTFRATWLIIKPNSDMKAHVRKAIQFCSASGET